MAGLDPKGSWSTATGAASFFASVANERFSGYIDFDSGGRKRRLFCDGGRVIAGQSAVGGENLGDFLLARNRLKPDDVARVRATAKERKIALDAAIQSLQLLDENAVSDANTEFASSIVKKCLTETACQWTASEKLGLASKFKSRPLELPPLLANSASDNPTRQPPAEDNEIQRTMRAMADKSAYEILESAETDAIDVIKKRYFDLAKRWHSDKFSGSTLSPADKGAIEHIFGQISEAYNLLSDETKRKEYDIFLDRKRKGLPTDVKQVVEAEGKFKFGESLLRRGENEAALKTLSEAVKLNPGEADFHAAYGMALYAVKGAPALKEALAALAKATAINEKLAVAHEYLGRIYKGENDTAKAKNHFNKCLQLNPKNINAQRELRLMNMREESGKLQPVKPSGGGLLSKIFKK